MSHRKHMEYCIKLGNPFVQKKLEQLDSIGQNQYIEETQPINYSKTQIDENMSFKDRLRNWNMQEQIPT